MNKLICFTAFLLLLTACTAAPSSSDTPAPTASSSQPALTPTATETASQPGGKALDDFESANTTWQAGKPPNYADSAAVSVSLSSKLAIQGKQSLAMTFGYDKPTAVFLIEGQFDLSRDQYLAFDLVDPQGVISAVALSLSTDSDWYWHASPPVALPPDATQVTFDLDAKTFQTAATNWQSTASVSNRGDVKRIALILYTKASGTAYLDNLRLLPAGALVNLPPTVQPQTGPTATPAPCPGKAAISASDAPLAISLPEGSALTRGSLVEFALSTTSQAANPYDPAQADLMVHYTAPDGAQFSIPAFWMQDFDPSTRQPCGLAGWKARLNPAQSGQWIAQAEIASQGLQSEATAFDVAEPPAGEAPLSIVRLHPTDSRYLALENGETFFPIGLNIGWWQNAPLEDYTRWLDAFAPNGGNLIRVWMASWSFGIEWQDTGLGNYDRRQYQAWLLDQLFQIAAERKVYIELVLLNHGAFSETTNPEWAGNPYNTANGGMCEHPRCFATDPSAKDYFKRRLRYIAARWGYAPNLFAWEWWNEYTWTPIPDEMMAAWVQEMTPYLLQYDPYDHLVSISSAGGIRPQVFNLPEIDFLQHHVYGSSDPMADFATNSKWYQQVIVPPKPVLFAEFGYSAGIEDANSFDTTGIHLHNGLWAATFSQYASPTMYWWWDSYIEPLNLWSQFGRLHTYIDGVDLAQFVPLGPGKISLSDKSKAILMALHSETEILAWVRNAKYDALSAQIAYSGVTDPATWEYHLDALSGLTLTTTALPDGAYTVEWYDPQTGAWQSSINMTIQGGSFSIEIPTFEFDLALRIRPAP